MSDRVTEQVGSLVRRLARHLNRKVSDIVLLLFNYKSATSIGALAGFAIALLFTYKFLRSPSSGGPRREKQRRRTSPSSNEEDTASSGGSEELKLNEVGTPVQLNLGQIVSRKLSGCRKISIQLLGVILEERSPEELQKQATVKPSVFEVVQEISKTCDIYLMERVLDDESEERILSALEGAGLFQIGGLTKEKVLFCSTENGRTSFVRQLEADWHVETNLDIVSQLSRFIGYQLHISPLVLGQIAPNVFTSSSLEQYFSCI